MCSSRLRNGGADSLRVGFTWDGVNNKQTGTTTADVMETLASCEDNCFDFS